MLIKFLRDVPVSSLVIAVLMIIFGSAINYSLEQEISAEKAAQVEKARVCGEARAKIALAGNTATAKFDILPLMCFNKNEGF
jgi:hypothetical protein